MSVIIISYPPGAGGNHLKNLLCTDSTFANSRDLNINVYETPSQPPGTVHSVPGRNIHQYSIEQVVDNPDQRWILHGHFGELAPYRREINDIPDKIFVMISINSTIDQQLLTHRQQRLGYGHHPYWNQEEQPYLYQPLMYRNWFNGELVIDVPLYDFWQPNLIATKFFEKIDLSVGSHIDAETAQNLHNCWWKQNFHFDFCTYTRQIYGIL